jgi:hypothetical protein
LSEHEDDAVGGDAVDGKRDGEDEGRAGPAKAGDARRRLAGRVGRVAGGRAKPEERDEAKKGEPERAKPGDVTEKGKPERSKARDEAKKDPKPKPLNRPRRQQPAGGAETKPKRGARAGDGKRRDRERGGEHEREPESSRRKRREGERRRKRSRRPAGARAKAGAATFATALKQGGSATRKWAAATAPKAGRRLLAALAAVFALFFEVLGFILNVLIAIGRRLAGPIGAVLRIAGRAARAGSRLLTPTRALAIVVAGAAVLLALSQYADYRTVAIGNDAYSGVQSLAPAPETGRLPTGDAHSYVFVPVAIACLLLLAVATIGRRWRACRLITLAGIAAVLVALIVDRPAGLDPGDAAIAFQGVHATLIGGFYAQIAAGILLIGSSTLLARELRLAAAGAGARSRSRGDEPAAKRSRRRVARRRPEPGPEGTARA